MPSDMFTESENSDLKTEVELIKRDLTGIANLVDRFDIAIEKLGDISDGMNRVLAVHELRLENQTKELDSFKSAFQEHREDHKRESDLLHDRISTKHHEVKNEVDRSLNNVCEKIDRLGNDIQRNQDDMKKRLEVLEKWKWWVMGIAVGLVFLLSQSKNLMELF